MSTKYMKIDGEKLYKLDEYRTKWAKPEEGVE